MRENTDQKNSEYGHFLRSVYKQRKAEIGKKIKPNPSNILRLNFCYLKFIRYLHLLYHPKIIGDVLKNVQKQVRLFKSGYMINDNENKVEIEKLAT